MKHLYLFFVTISLVSCNSPDAADCFQTNGNLVEVELPIENFSRLKVNRNISVEITQANNYKVIVKTGENLINDITAEVNNGLLELTDNNTCNLVRSYANTTIYIEAPLITEINSSTQYTIRSNGVLNVDTLHLVSEDFVVADSFPLGDFHLNVNTENLSVVSNNLSFFYINGSTENLNITFAAGNGRFEGRHLVAEHVILNHRGSNDMVVNPQQSINGVIRSTGDVIAVNTPPIVDVQELYTGQLLQD